MNQPYTPLEIRQIQDAKAQTKRFIEKEMKMYSPGNRSKLLPWYENHLIKLDGMLAKAAEQKTQ